MINKMTEQQKPTGGSSQRNIILWLSVFILFAAGIVAFYYFQDLAVAIKAAVGLVLVCVIIGLALQTSQGQLVGGYFKQTRMELRKVVWPTRQETVQTTLVVVGMVILMALILWGIDSLLLWIVSWFTGQRG